jgi:nucleoside-diphosphate-sugar epimerase
MDGVIAITGATGFAGRHVVAELLRRGHAVKALVRNLEKANLPPDVTLIEGDLSHHSALAELSEGAAAVVHVAGAIAASSADAFNAANVKGTAAVADAAIAAGVPRLVHVSSLSAREPHLSAYGASKLGGEKEILARQAEISAAIIRPPAVYGPGDKATLPLFKALTQSVALIPGSPAARFSLVYVEDLARTVADTAESKLAGITTVSDGRAGGYGWPDLLRTAIAIEGHAPRVIYLPRPLVSLAGRGMDAIAALTGKALMLSGGKAAELYHPDWVVHDENPRSGLVQFEDGFRRTLAWYRKEGWLPPPRLAARTPGHRETMA